MALKQKLKSTIDWLGIGEAVDKMRFYVQYLTHYKSITQSRLKLASVPLPEPFMIYETFKLDYNRYYESGREDAQAIYDEVRPFFDFNHKYILDWGCGPGRVIRHFPNLVPSAHFAGCDYNKDYVRWSKKHLSGIEFFQNQLLPPPAGGH